MSKKQLPIPLDDAAKIIHIDGGQPWTDSRMVAEKFGKSHHHVLRDIRKLKCSSGFRLSNFGESSYINDQGKEQPMMKMNRDGFTILAMGFTGEDAMIWKEKYIDAFNRMERELTQQAIRKHDAAWQQARLSGKIARIELTDAVKAFVEYAHAQGSTNPASTTPVSP